MTLSLNIALPSDFRLPDFIEFHSRDVSGIAERTSANSLEKGILWSGLPARIRLNFENHIVIAELSLDGAMPAQSESKFESLVFNMLGLNQSTSRFEANFEFHPHIGKLIAEQHGLRVPQSVSLFEALTWAITGQQISLSAAISIRRKLIQHVGIIHSSGIACYPDATQIALISEDDFRFLGFSKSKATTLVNISRMVTVGTLSLDEWNANKPIEEITQTLLNIKGIGRWTVNYTLLRGLGWLDGSLHGDAAVRNKLSLLLNSHNEISEKETSIWLEQFSPWRALVAAHLWAMKKPIL